MPRWLGAVILFAFGLLGLYLSRKRPVVYIGGEKASERTAKIFLASAGVFSIIGGFLLLVTKR
jgi:hypothetical protein